MSRRSSVKIPLVTLKALKTSIERKFGRKINSTPSCHQLAEDIFNATGKLLSYNTLRRFFGLLNTNPQINITSLTILANYCGYKNLQGFNELRDDVRSYDLQNSFHFLVSQNKIEIAYVKKCCEEFYKYPEIYHFLDKCLLLAFAKRDIDFFINIFSVPHVFDEHPYNKYNIYHLAQNYAQIILLLPEKSKMILQKIVKNRNAQKFYFELFVDINNVCGYYGEILNQYAFYKDTYDSTIFNLCIQILRCFLLKEKRELSILHKELEKMVRPKVELHAILRGRIIASSIFYNYSLKSENTNSNLFKKIKTELLKLGKEKNATSQVQLYLVFIFQALQWTRNIFLLDKIVNLIHKNLLLHEDTWAKDANHHLQIYFAHALIFKGEVQEAEGIIKGIATDKFPLFESAVQLISYNLMLIDFFKVSKNKKELLRLSNEIKLIAQKHNYTFFKNILFS